MSAPEPPEPVYCRPEGYRLLAEQLPRLETARGLLLGAVAVAMHEVEDADPDAVEHQIADMVQRVRGRVKRDDPKAILAHAHELLFDELGFVGNASDYYNPRNSYLPLVLKTREGLPITLTLVYKCVLDGLGVAVHGINAPGHFMAGVDLADSDDTPPTRMLVDPFQGGRVLTREEAFKRIDELAGRRVPRDDNLLQPATHAQWLFRLLQNLVLVFDRLGRRESLLAMQEMQGLIERDAH